MATLPRQPFAPLDGARLQSLTSLKNRQNAFSPTSGKRKADSIDRDDSENIDPSLFSKRSKGSDFYSSSGKDYFKPSSFVLTKAASSSTPSAFKPSSATTSYSAPSTFKPSGSSRARSIIQPKSPAAKLNTSLAAASPLAAPAGRSPTRGNKRIGILSNRRRTASPFTRVDPPVFSLGSSAAAAPFSLDAALKGTISSYASRTTASATAKVAAATPLSLDSGLLFGEAEVDNSWIFDIHEDTPEQEMTNLLQHSTCVLDISSDEETEQKQRRERALDKENIPPPDDVSQTSRQQVRADSRASADDMVVEKMRGPLAEMNAADYYADGCDSTSIIIVPGDEDDEQVAAIPSAVSEESDIPSIVDEAFGPKLDLPAAEPYDDASASVDDIMGKRDVPAPQAALLEPIEGTGESFELWESGSAKAEDEAAAPLSPAPALAEEEQEVAVDTAAC